MAKVVILSNTDGYYALAKKSLNSLRKAIGIVQQDVYLFTGSILENIERMGYGSIIPAPIRKMLKAMEERSEAMASDVVSGGEIHRQHRDK